MDKQVESFAANGLIQLLYDHQFLSEMCAGLEAFFTNWQ